MGVYIKDMEMPTGGDSILFRIDEKLEVVAYKVRGCKTNFLNRYKAMLIPPHGDLIDRDALRDNNCDAFELNGADETILAMDVSIIDDAPAIIPASE